MRATGGTYLEGFVHLVGLPTGGNHYVVQHNLEELESTGGNLVMVSGIYQRMGRAFNERKKLKIKENSRKIKSTKGGEKRGGDFFLRVLHLAEVRIASFH